MSACLSCRADVDGPRLFCPSCSGAEAAYADCARYGDVVVVGSQGNVTVRAGGAGASGASAEAALKELAPKLALITELRARHAEASTASGVIQGQLREMHAAHDAKLQELLVPIEEEKKRHKAAREVLEAEQMGHENLKADATAALKKLLLP